MGSIKERRHNESLEEISPGVFHGSARLLKAIGLILCASLVCACSNEQIYTAIQDNQRLECSKLPEPQYEKCMAELETPYDEYERDRREVLEGEAE